MIPHALALAAGILLELATSPLPIHPAVMMCPAKPISLECPRMAKIIDEMEQGS